METKEQGQGDIVTLTEVVAENGCDDKVEKITLQLSPQKAESEKRGQKKESKVLWQTKPAGSGADNAASDENSECDEEAMEAENENGCSDNEEVASPVKRGRGRPPKPKSANDSEEAPASPAGPKRGRGRPPKPITPGAKIAETPSPSKRGRGRPPKAEGEATLKKAPAKVVEIDSGSSDQESGSNNNDVVENSDDEDYTSPVKKGRGRGRPSKRAKVDSSDDDDDDEDYDASPSKRGRGRPKSGHSKSALPKKDGRGRGRPKGSMKRVRRSDSESNMSQIEKLLETTLSNCLEQQRMEMCTFIDMKLARLEQRLDSMEKLLQQFTDKTDKTPRKT